MITLSIDISKIDKTRFKKARGRDGSDKQYLELVMFEAPSEYGDWIVKQQVSKEERAAGKQLPILGNGKNWSKGQQQAPAQTAEKAESGNEDSVPF